MAMNYGGEGGDGLERGTSADAAELQQEQTQAPQEPDWLGRVEALIDSKMSRLEGRVQSFSDRTLNTVQGQINALAEVINTARGGDDDSLDVVREWVENSLSGEERQALLDRVELRRSRKQKAEPAPKPQPQPQGEQVASWDDEQQDLIRYAKTKGFTEEDIAAPNWMARLHGVGLPDPNSYPATARGRRQYKNDLYEAMDREAKRVSDSRRGRTVVPAVQTAGAGGKTWDQAQKIKSLSEMSDDDYERFISQKR